MPYDWESGLVFDETVQHKHKTQCMAELLARSSHLNSSSTSTKKGTNTLYDTALRLLLAKVDCLEMDALKHIPGTLLGRIWNAAVRSSSSSFILWKHLARSGHFSNRHSKTVTAGCSNCNPLDLGAIMPLISSPSLSWVTHLSLETIQLSTSELTKLADLTSLRTLYLRVGPHQEPFPVDNIIRAWAASAKGCKAFGVLQMMFLDVSRPLSTWTFHYLNAFPALDTFALRTTSDQGPLELQADAYGWHGREKSKFLRHARKWLRARSDDERSRCYWSDCVLSFVKKQEDLNVAGDLPRLQVRCGAPHGGIFSCDELLCFKRDWEWVGPAPPSKAEVDKGRDGVEQPTKRRKLKASKRRNLDDLLAGF
ncbi:hypothetical protein M409DRAFT_19477 [Zasmidium cellare ATCC 36951]|uniref:Uncharacterized protein n=1 Tax=Zasmidium cellare ATCC 36951 TaxID=1080233 RepID=A0A6A6CXS2_ZASCE|nr:uncharacterized protein M409DRAFT_19477 [Zasmidium cellare ATCC 36951]KAF2170662.1 hypothetical protein M409DRAFT_19477 [Zasmidium cellare ATCC 36951]